MPLLNLSDPLPDWSDLDFINLIELKKSKDISLLQKSPKEKFFIGEGECNFSFNEEKRKMMLGEFVEINNPGKEINISADEDSTIIHIGGRWNDETGSCGVFKMNNSGSPKNIGDPVDYKRTTEFDNHFHDCDEYWIIFKGSGLAVSEGKKYKLLPGTILATKAGDHHDLPEVYEEIHGVWFETSLKGKKRKGHLWIHTHG